MFSKYYNHNFPFLKAFQNDILVANCLLRITSIGYVISEESFFDSVSFLDFAKIRGSWGQTGNDNVAAFQFLASYGLANTSLGNVVTTAYETKVPNPNITWETQTSTNIGIWIAFDYLS